MTFEGSSRSISSRGSEAGRSPSDSQDGVMTATVGPAPRHASRSASSGNAPEQMTLDICGQSSTGSSESAALSASLASRCREQSKHGWLDGVSADLEAEGYAVGAVVLGAHSAGGPHIRQRLWWGAQRMADANGVEAKSETQIGFRPEYGDGRGVGAQRLGDADSPRPQGRGCESGADENKLPPWSSGHFVECSDGKYRWISPESCDVPLADGVSEVMGSRRAAEAPSRVAMLRVYGNAIVPETGAMFVRAWMELT